MKLLLKSISIFSLIILHLSVQSQDFSVTLTVGAGADPITTTPIPVTLEFGNTIENIGGTNGIDLDDVELLLNGFLGNGYIINLEFDGNKTFTYEIVPVVDGPISIAIIETFAYDENGNTNESIWEVYDYDQGSGEVFSFVAGIPTAIATLNAADGDGSTDWLRNIIDIEVSPSGQVFLTDLTHHKVLTTSGGNLITYAGASTDDDDGGFVDNNFLLAQFFGPGDMAINESGDVYVADLGNYRIRKLANGEVTTVAGNGAIGVDVGPALTSAINIGKIAFSTEGVLYFSNNARTIIYKLENEVISLVLDLGTSKINDLQVMDNGDLLFSASSGLYSYNEAESSLNTILSNIQVSDIELTSAGEVFFMTRGSSQNSESFFEPGLFNLYKANSEFTEFTFVLNFDRLFYVEILTLSPTLFFGLINNYYQGNSGMISLANDNQLFVNFSQNVWSVDLIEAAVDDPPVLNEPITDFRVLNNRSTITIDLNGIATDEDNADSGITFSVSANNNTSLVATSVSDSELTLTFTQGTIGSADITITATSNGQSVDNVFTVIVEGAPSLLFSQQGEYEGSYATQILPDYDDKILEIVDEFSIAAGDKWEIDAVTVVGSTTGTFSEARFTIYENEDGSVGDIVFESDIIPTESFDFTGQNASQNGNFRLLLQQAINIEGGDYWLSVQTRQVFDNGGGFWRWAYTTPAAGLDILARDPDNLIGGLYPTDFGSIDLDGSMIFGIYGTNLSLKTWTGVESNDWGTSNNWSDNLIPTSTDNVFIPSGSQNLPVVNGDYAVANMEIQSGAGLEIISGSSLAVFGSVSGDGSVKILRNVMGGSGLANSGGYNIMGSSVADATVGDLDNPNLVYSFDGTSYLNITNNSSMSLTPGAGYFVAYDDVNPTMEISGKLNSGEITYALGTSSEFHLVSNPYAAAIERVSFIAENGTNVIDGAIYLWDDGGSNDGSVRAGSYITVDASGNVVNGSFDGNIRSSQGFYVYSGSDESPEVVFKPTMQALDLNANDDTGYYRRSKENSLIRLKISDGINADELLINLSENASTDHDDGMDIRKLMNPEVSFYSTLGEEKLAIQALPFESRNLKVGLQTSTEGAHTIELIQNDSEANITLVDKLLNVRYDLLDNNPVKLQIVEFSNINRFILEVKLKEVLALESEFDDLHVFGSTSGLTLEYEGFKEAEVSICSIEGKIVFEDQISFQDGMALIKPNLKSNVLYVLKLNNVVTKFVLNH